MLWGVPPWQALTRKVDPADLVNLSTFDSTMGMPMPLDVQVCADGAHPRPAHTSHDPPAEADPCFLLSSQLKMMKEANRQQNQDSHDFEAAAYPFKSSRPVSQASIGTHGVG
jgi:hypothetical protein